MNKPAGNVAVFSSPARTAQALVNLGHNRFEALLFPVYTPEEVQEKRKYAEERFADAQVMPLVYAFPPTEKPLARFRDNGEVPGTASKVLINELDRAKLLNVLIVAARFGTSTPREVILNNAYTELARSLIDQCGRAPLTKRI